MKHLSKLDDSQLKKRRRICLGIAIGILIVITVFIIFALLEISHNYDHIVFTALAPGILLIFLLFPMIYSAAISKEMKRRH